MTCGCGCGEEIAPGARRRYKDERHRDRAYRKRLRARLEAAGLPTRLTLALADASTPTHQRRTDAQRGGNRPRTRREGVTVYLPSVEVAEAVQMALLGPVDPSPEILTAALRFNAALERRRRARV